MSLLYDLLNKELKLLGSLQAQFFTLLSICKYNIQCLLALIILISYNLDQMKLLEI